MIKRNIVIICLLLVFLLIFISMIKFNTGYKITIINNTDKTITNLELKYKTGSIIEIIPQIESQKYWKNKIDTNKIFEENAIILVYSDDNGNSCEEYVVGYIEKGYKGQASVIIDNIDDNGQLEIKVEK